MLFVFHSSIRYLDGIVLGITCWNKRQLLLNIIFIQHVKRSARPNDPAFPTQTDIPLFKYKSGGQ